MNYLAAEEFEGHGLEAATPMGWVAAASALIDAHCRRETLAVAQYTERLRLTKGCNTVRLSYLPLTRVSPAPSALLSVRGRYAPARRGEAGENADWAAEAMQIFGLPGMWNELDPLKVDLCEATGELSFTVNALGLGFSEVEVTYTAGVAEIPEGVKCACAQIVRNALATPALNVRAGNLDRMHLAYFSDTLLDQTAVALLAPYVAQKVG